MTGQPMRPRNVGGCPCPDCGNDRPSTERAKQKRQWHAEVSAETMRAEDEELERIMAHGGKG